MAGVGFISSVYTRGPPRQFRPATREELYSTLDNLMPLSLTTPEQPLGVVQAFGSTPDEQNALEILRGLSGAPVHVRRAALDGSTTMQTAISNLQPFDPRLVPPRNAPRPGPPGPASELDGGGPPRRARRHIRPTRVPLTLAQAAPRRRGVPAELLSVIPTVPFPRAQDPEGDESLQTCAICYAPYMLNEATLRLPCMHMYHEACVTGWLESHTSCPVCQTDVLQTILDAHARPSTSSPLAFETSDAPV